jgi:preprotein translocase subunit SecY
MKVEIPLSFGRIRGHGIRWPLKFLYTSNIPVILIAALLANVQLWAKVLESAGKPILGTFAGGTPVSGIVSWLFPPRMVEKLLAGSVAGMDIAQAIVYILIMTVGALIFSLLWVQTSGMDASSQARQMMKSGLQIPGFRRDIRVMEQLLSRYITPLTAMGGIAIGLLAAIADLLGALAAGTSILLSVMIIYQLYENIAEQHMVDMHPGLKKMMGG